MTYTFAYDVGGNITSRTKYAYTTGTLGTAISTDTYTYDTVNKDRLVSYNGQAITYDVKGNPLTYKGNTLTWDRVRLLSSYGTNTFAYNASGARTRKNNINYVVNRGAIHREYDASGRDITYYYDVSGVCGFKYSGSNYFYAKNLQGDITDIYHANGTKYASYEYDAWGNCTITLDTNGIGTLNPFRYRGYYYDAETNLYYLKSRYYDPAVGRFLNQDVVVGANRDITTYNLFAYCGNNPVSRYDVGGTRWKAIIEGFLDALNERAIEMGIDTAAVGAFLLNMDADEKGIYHASQDCWQQYAGYNDFYDFAFDVGTDMDVKKFPFSYNGKNYMIWAWKGDYINLGAGAEIGIYTGNDPHWFVDTSLAMPMSLSLDYKGENIISYTDGGDQWWCTAFNPNYLNVKASDLTATFRLTFKSEKMYSAFKKAAYKGWTFNDRRLTARFVF